MLYDKHRGGCRLYDSLAGLLILGVLLLFVFACASSTAAPGKGTGQNFAVVPVEKAGLFSKPSPDAVMLNEGASWMGLSGRPADFAKAREIFTVLAKDHPESKWRPLAEGFIRMIDAIGSLQANNLSAQAQMEKLLQDNEQLRGDIQTLRGKFQAERAGLQQENEQLKKDLELLRKLEVQLDQREKMLR
jgi:ABC-type phosphate transport system auxiliary subunit